MDLNHLLSSFRSRRQFYIWCSFAGFSVSNIDFSQVAYACGSALELSTRYDLNEARELRDIHEAVFSPFNNTGSAPDKIDQESIEVEFFPRSSNDSQGCGLSKRTAACASTAALQIRFRPPYDEDTPTQQLGYRIEIIGDFPPDIRDTIHESQFFAPEGILNLEFLGDVELARQLSIVIRPLDPEGNLGEPSEAAPISLP